MESKYHIRCEAGNMFKREAGLKRDTNHRSYTFSRMVIEAVLCFCILATSILRSVNRIWGGGGGGGGGGGEGEGVSNINPAYSI